jgi:hypothetical protein
VCSIAYATYAYWRLSGDAGKNEDYVNEMNSTEIAHQVIIPTLISPSNTLRDQVLDAMHVPSLGQLYAIAPFPKRINFASQQTRAFNLVWALIESGRIDTESSVAVIGAGLAGLTAASALMRRGIGVKIFEASDQILKIQRYTTSRFVHPSLNYWPLVSLDPTANFPCLYWSADTCNVVISTIRKQWETEFGNGLVSFNSRVSSLQSSDGKISFHLEGGAITHPFDTVILAVGFGLENPAASAFLPSYWDNDDPRRSDMSKPVFISGVGDGGLLEALRLVYDEFGEGQLTSRLAHLARKHNLEERIRGIEVEAASKHESDPSGVSSLLAQKYQMLPLTEELDSLFTRHLSGNRAVKIVSRGPHAFTHESAPIHRLMLARAIQARRIEVLTNTSVETDKKGLISIGGKAVQTTNATVIIRHGPSGEIGKLLEKKHLDPLADRQKVLSPYQYRHLWPDGYFDKRVGPADGGARQVELEVRLTTILPSLVKEFAGTSFEVAEVDGALCYRARLQTSSKLTVEDLPAQILGNTLIAVPQSWKPLSRSSPWDSDIMHKFRPLRAGDNIRVSGPKGGRQSVGKIGAFLRSARGRASYALCARHVVGTGETTVFAEGDSTNWYPIGKVLQQRTVEFDDVALVELDGDIEYQVPQDAPTRVDEGLSPIGRSVRVLSHLGAPVYGRITGVARNVFVDELPSSDPVERAFIVSAIDGKPFARSGDSGALVSLDDGSALGIIIAASGSEILVSPIGRVLAAENAEFAKRPSSLVRLPEPAIIKSIIPRDPGTRANWRDFEEQVAELFRREDISSIDGDHTLMDRPLFYVHVRREIERGRILRNTFFTDDIVVRSPLGSEFQILQIKNQRDSLGRDYNWRWQEFVIAKELTHLAFEHAPDAEIRRAIVRALRGAPVPFDIARSLSDMFLATKLHQYASEGSTVEPSLRPTIEPAIYEIPFLGQATGDRRKARSELAVEVSLKLGKKWLETIDEMVKGHLVTFQTANAVEALLKYMGRQTSGVQMAEPEQLSKVRAAYSERFLRKLPDFDKIFGNS